MWHSSIRARLRARLVDREAGSAITEFVMVTTLLLFVALAVFQLGLALYVRNTLISAASEGARYGARADSHVTKSVDRTRAIIRSGLNDTYAQAVTARETVAGGIAVVEVTVSAPVPVLGLLGPAGTMTLSGRAFNERVVVGAAR